MAFAFGTAAPAPYIAGLLLANAFGWGWPGLLHLAVARRFPTATAAASGVTQTGVSAGLLLGPLLLGLVITRAGWFEAWALATGAALAAAAAVLLVRQPLNRAAG
jgi:predicted MFS family arabinose efflux permease